MIIEIVMIMMISRTMLTTAIPIIIDVRTHGVENIKFNTNMGT